MTCKRPVLTDASPVRNWKGLMSLWESGGRNNRGNPVAGAELRFRGEPYKETQFVRLLHFFCNSKRLFLWKEVKANRFIQSQKIPST
jgi:hypothetical protein